MLSSRSARALRGLAVAAVTALVPAIAGCEAGANSPTQQWHQPTPGASATLNQISISNMFVLGPGTASTLPAGASASLFLALANNGTGTDRLVSISAPGAASSVTMPRGGVALAGQGVALLQGPAPVVVLRHLTRPLRGGQNVAVTLYFQNAGKITLRVPVMPRAASYATFSPPAASPSPTATGHHKAKATASPTPSATVSASPTPTG